LHHRKGSAFRVCELRSASRAGSPLLFGLAPRGVFRASDVATRAVGSYPTFSPLPNETSIAKASRRFTCAMPPSCPAGGLFSVALSVNRSAIRGEPRINRAAPQALPGALPICPEGAQSTRRVIRHRLLRAYDDGVRTFLPSSRLATTRPTITRLTRYVHYIRERSAMGAQFFAQAYFVPTSFSNSASVSTGTSSSFALSYFEPGSVPTTT